MFFVHKYKMHTFVTRFSIFLRSVLARKENYRKLAEKKKIVILNILKTKRKQSRARCFKRTMNPIGQNKERVCVNTMIIILSSRVRALFVFQFFATDTILGADETNAQPVGIGFLYFSGREDANVSLTIGTVIHRMSHTNAAIEMLRSSTNIERCVHENVPTRWAGE